ncbi:MAG TPA: hypothetical protein VFE51_31495, partial [Verrucomicrobiae bacterium]|nr:hypothetical protein [Verrucomicrobiae bacterium]
MSFLAWQTKDQVAATASAKASKRWFAKRGSFAILLAKVGLAWVYFSMGTVHETESRWWGVGEFVLWVIFYF